MKTYLGDTHCHTEFSFDSDQKIKDIIKVAEEKNLEFIALTDHVEFGFQSVDEVINNISFRNDEIDKLNKTTNIKILKGIEVSEPHKYLEQYETIKNYLELDYILGSIHHIDGVPLRKACNNSNIYDSYLKNILEMIEKTDVDTIAHFDYIKKFTGINNFDKYLLKEVLASLVEYKKILEINASGIRRVNEVFPSEEILNMYYDLGGRKITFGSDAHNESEIYDNIDVVSNSLKQNFKPGYVSKRKFRRL